MIKITHIEKGQEKKICEIIAKFLKKKYPFYFEIKNYENGVSTYPTLKITSKELESI